MLKEAPPPAKKGRGKATVKSEPMSPDELFLGEGDEDVEDMPTTGR